MKICKECGHFCEDDIFVCENCGSRRLPKVSDKVCVYCGEKVAVGTIICPHCHRVLPPESEESGSFSQISQMGEINANVHVIDPIPFSAVDVSQSGKFGAGKQASDFEIDVRTSDIKEYDSENPLFALGKEQKTADLSVEEADFAEEAEEIVQKQSKYQEPQKVLQTEKFKTRVISREEEKPQSKTPRIALFLFICIFSAIGLWTDYMVHDFGNVVGFDMSCAIFTKYRDSFPSLYPYILYGSGMLSKYEVMGSYLPFAMVNGIVVSVYAGITLMISAVPKWIVAVLNGISFALQTAGVVLLAFLFGSECVGIGGYILVIGSLATFVLHLVCIKRVFRKPRI